MLTDAAYVEIVESRGLEPASQIVSHHRGLGLEDGERDGSLSDRRSFWLEGDYETTSQTFIFHHLVPQELEGEGGGRVRKSHLHLPSPISPLLISWQY